MKKILTLTLCFILAGCLVLAACGNAGEKVEEVTEDIEAVAEDVGSAAEEAADEAVDYAQQLLDEGKDKFDEAKTAVEDEGEYVLSILAQDGNKIVYEFTIVKDELEVTAAEAEDKINNAASEFEVTLQNLADKGAEEAQIIVKYLDKEGKEIVSKIFHNEPAAS